MKEKKNNLTGTVVHADHLFLGVSDPTAKPSVYALRKAVIMGKDAYFICGKCGRPVMVGESRLGLFRKTCGFCHTQTIVRGIDKDKVKQTQKKKEEHQESKVANNGSKRTDVATLNFKSSRKQVNAKLVWGGLFSKKTYILRLGENWIGRKDDEIPSDVRVNDEYMSRKSACITVMKREGVFSFFFKLHKASNPVRVNGRELKEGESVYLNYEDYIEMGKTRFFVKKVK